MNYRQEIDGLRTIAVMAVVIYHAAFALGDSIWLSGGYIGVDVFFVISGYLITRIIIQKEVDDRFSLRDFYIGRIRRIVPALAVMVLLVMPLGWRSMLPDQFETMAQSALGALGYYSNFVFAFEDAYNAEASTIKPLLHTWSLSLGVQFYILFPLLMLLLMRTKYSIYAVGVLTLVGGLSLLIAQIMAATNQTYNFFLLPSRSWELLAGSLLAISEVIKGRRETPEIVTLWLPTAGMVAIIGSFIFFDDAMPLPGLLTLIPIAGTMAIIWSAQKGELVGDLLSLAPVVYIGKISYSLYLWHFPVSVFMRISGVGFETPVLKVIGIILSFGLALLSYYLVERPFRDRQIMGSRQFGFAMVSVMALAAFAHISVLTSNGMQKRLDGLTEYLETATPETLSINGRDCNDRSFSQICRVFNGQTNVILMGDGHAAAISAQLNKAAAANKWTFSQITASSCTILPGIDRQVTAPVFWLPERRQYCKDLSARTFATLKSTPPAVLVLHARWPMYFESDRFDNGEGGVDAIAKGYLKIGPDTSIHPEAETVADVFVASVKSLAEMGHQVVVVLPQPEMGWDVPKKLNATLLHEPVSHRAEAAKSSARVSISLAAYQKRTASLRAALAEIEGVQGVSVVDPSQWTCVIANKRCYGNDTKGIYYSDRDHASTYGAALLSSEIANAIASTRAD